MSPKRLRGPLLSLLALTLSGCKLVLLDPAGDVARQQSDLMIASVILMSLIVVPVLVAIGVIAWRYRASNPSAAYEPEWDHSTQFELVVWAAPLLIIVVLGAMTWIGTHQMDPYRPLRRISAHRPVLANIEPLEVEVVSLDWKWLFFYPQYGIATVNEMAAPVDRPIHFRLTSKDTMNAFFVPTLAGMIYTMPGMQTVLHAVINKPGDYEGQSTNYSGSGFTDMRFRFHGLSDADFTHWVAKVRTEGDNLDARAFDRLDEPSRAEPAHYYARFDAGLYRRILNQCADPHDVCPGQMAPMGPAAMAAMPGHDPGEARSADPSPAAPAHDAATH